MVIVARFYLQIAEVRQIKTVYTGERIFIQVAEVI